MEHLGVPGNLIVERGKPIGEPVRARAPQHEVGKCDVAFMIRGIQFSPVPAGGEHQFCPKAVGTIVVKKLLSEQKVSSKGGLLTYRGETGEAQRLLRQGLLALVFPCTSWIA